MKNKLNLKRIFMPNYSSLNLLVQSMIVAIFIAIAVIVEYFTHFHIGIYHVCIGSNLIAFIMPLFVSFWFSIIGSFVLITIGEFVISAHPYFWMSFVPLFLVAIIIQFFKQIKKRTKIFWLFIGYALAWIVFVSTKTIIAYSVLQKAEFINFALSTVIEMALCIVFTFFLFIPSFKLFQKKHLFIYTGNYY